MKTERLQVLIDTVQRERLETTAAARGVSVAHLVRTAIDVVYPPDSDRRRAAAAAILDVLDQFLEPFAVGQTRQAVGGHLPTQAALGLDLRRLVDEADRAAVAQLSLIHI